MSPQAVVKLVEELKDKYTVHLICSCLNVPISTPIPTATTLGTGTQPDQHSNKYSLKNAHKKEKLCI